MKKSCYKTSLVFVIIVLFIGMGVNPSTGTIVVKKSTIPIFNGKTLYVGGNGTGNYSKIQDAIDDAINGDTVYVYDDSSPYYENLLVDKSISLLGEDKNTTIIDGSNKKEFLVNIDVPYVTVTGFTLQNCPLTGININDLENDIGWSDTNRIFGNIIKNNGIGIEVVASYNNHIYRNNITNNGMRGGGISVLGYIGDSYNNSIYQNNIMGNFIGIDLGTAFGGDARQNIIYQNNFICNKINALERHHIFRINHWDNGEEGNYWDNYIGRDADGDGIGDRPYWISRFYDSKDNYPLMKPFGNITSFNKNIKSINQRFNNWWFNSLLDRFPMLQRLLEELIR